MLTTVRAVLGFVIALLFFSASSAQEVSVKLGPDQIGSNQMWTITVTIENERLKNYSPFPEIEGFVKRGTSSSTSSARISPRTCSSMKKKTKPLARMFTRPYRALTPISTPGAQSPRKCATSPAIRLLPTRCYSCRAATITNTL